VIRSAAAARDDFGGSLHGTTAPVAKAITSIFGRKCIVVDPNVLGLVLLLLRGRFAWP
jgi:hypothetical protein